MSSFVGHGLAALTAHAALHDPSELGEANRTASLLPKTRNGWLWLVWLIAIAWFPDLDHWLKPLHSSSHNGLRITHSLLFCQLLPILTVIYLVWKGDRGKPLLNLTLQASLAGLSQPLLDLFVGIAGLPLFWPLSPLKIKFPGLLPSAGRLDPYNYFFYRNLAIEMGVLLPLSFCVVWWRWRLALPSSEGSRIKPGLWRIIPLILALALSCIFMGWSASLSR